MSIYTLYIKTHNKSGLKYLGQTKQDPFKYKGSGDLWLAHISQYGNNTTTEILLQTSSKEERNYWGRYYSRLWNVVGAMDDYGNKIWANKIPETGGGGATIITESQRKQISQSLKGHSVSAQTRKKIGAAGKGRTAWNKGLTKETDDRVALNGKATSKGSKGRTPWNKGAVGLQEAWNKGLTKETDNRVAQYAKTLSIVNKVS